LVLTVPHETAAQALYDAIQSAVKRV